jgi:hypothetical protein
MAPIIESVPTSRLAPQAASLGGDGGSSNFVGGWTDVVYYAYVEDCLSNDVPAEAPGTAQTQVPTSLAVVSQSYTQGPPVPYNYHRVYQIRDQNGNAMQGYAPNGLHVTETYTPNPPSGNCTAAEVVTGSGYADGNGRFPDDYKLSGSPPNPCSTTSTQKHFVNRRQVSTISVQWQYSGVTVGSP